tara:strand:- start:169 stop:432 length:264 start_codon:yes stop_codon:yes gene_type:complete
MEMTITEVLIDLAIPAAMTLLAAVFGFVWKISHRVSALEKQLEAERNARANAVRNLERDVQVIYDNVDKNREWTTNRMMSIVRDVSK